jgi:hypothetical protein
MGDQNEQGVVKPEVVMLETLLVDITAGRLRVPRFQRPFVWERGQMLDLFDSIERGYPIGSILTWETHALIPSLDTVAGIEIPSRRDDGPVSYLLDGHQRLSTLFGTLIKRPGPRDSSADGKWRIYRSLGPGTPRSRTKFQHWPSDTEPPITLLPMQAVLRTMDFLGYARKLSRGVEDADEADALVDEAEQLAQQIKSYKIAVIRLVGGNLSHAVEAFARLNSGGREITAQDMVSALTYRPESVYSLSDRIDTIRRGIAASGFGALHRDLIFQAVVALGEADNTVNTRWSDFATDISGRLDDVVARADVAIARAVQFLRYEAGVSHTSLLPYQLQVVLIAVYLDRLPHPDRLQARALVRWFWATSWSGTLHSTAAFAYQANLVRVRDPRAFKDPVDEDFVGPATGFPASFDADHGRVRAYLSWELREFGQRLALDGQVVDAADLYTRSGPAAYRMIIEDGPWAPENAIMLASSPGVGVQDALRALPPRQLREVIVSHGIPADALAYLFAGDGAAFMKVRRAFLEARERAFMQEMGVEPPPIENYEADDA